MLGAKKEEKVLNTQGQIKLLTLADIIFEGDTLNHTVSGQRSRMKMTQGDTLDVALGLTLCLIAS